MKFNYLLLTNFRQFRYLLFSALMMVSSLIFAQPANDKCSGAISIAIANDEASCVWTNGTTLNTTDGASTPGPTTPCSTNFVRDDVWYKLSIPAGSENKLITIKVEVGSQPTDMPSVGMAAYNAVNCTTGNAPFNCSNFAAGAENTIVLSGLCNQEILVRVWSSTGTSTNWQDGQGTFRICAYMKDNVGKTPVIWGANGEGSFNGGLNGWTTGGDMCTNSTPTGSLWTWVKDAASHGPLWGGQVIASPTSCNGAMIFDSDLLDNGGTGPCLAPQMGYLESPTIDISQFNIAGVTLEFRQRVTQFLSQYFIDYSIDNGQNWFNIEINQDIEAFTTNTPPGVDPTRDETRRVHLPNAQGASQLKIRFRAQANYYYWLIDDVRLVEREAYNLAVNDFFAIAPNKLWQKDQLEGFGGLADIANNGASPAKHVKLKLDIKDQSQNIIWTDELNYGTVKSDTVIQNLPMPGTFNHPNNNPASYSGTYTITNDSTDFDFSDNTRNFSWTVTDSIMSKEDNVNLGNGTRAASSVNFTWGNIYHIVKNKDASGKNLLCNNVQVGVSNPDQLTGASLFIFMYKWDNADGDNAIQPTELTTVGFYQLDFDGSDAPNSLFTVPMLDFNTFSQGVFVDANADYIIAAQYNAPTSNPTLALFINSDANLDYGAQDLRTTVVPGQPRFSHVLDAGNTGTLAPVTFNGGTVPVIRMELVNHLVSTDEPQLDNANKITIAPNPVKDILNVKMDLVSEFKKATIEILDLNGKTILTKELNSIKYNTESFNVSNLTSGTYFMTFKSEAGTRTLKFIISK